MLRGHAVQGWQLMERDGWKSVVLGMKRHVPRKKADDWPGEGRAAVLKHIGDKGTSAVLGHQIQPQKRLAEDDRHNPQPQQSQALQGN